MPINGIKLIIFDVDGVLINSKKNMEYSFNKMCVDNSIKDIKFKSYFQNIGKQFENIMKDIGINKNIKKLKKEYFVNTRLFKNKIKPYQKVYSTLSKLQKKFYLGIVTSKIKKNTLNFMSHFFPKIKFEMISSPTTKLKGKPHPDLILNMLKKLKIPKNQSVYVGDTYHDFLTTKNAKINFIFAKYGYNEVNKKKISTKHTLKKFSEILDLVK